MKTCKELIPYQPPLSETLLKNGGHVENAEAMLEEPGPSSSIANSDIRLRIREMENWDGEDMEEVGSENDQLVTYPESGSEKDGSEISPNVESSSDSYDNVQITEVDDTSMEVD